MVELECSDNVPLWPIIYYKSRGGATTLHLLFSLFTRYISVSESTWTFFFILFRVTSNTQGYFFNFLWPVFHYESSENGSWKFSIRPLFWVHSEQDTLMVTLAGIIFYRRSGDNRYFHIAPFIFYKSSRSKSMFILFPFLYIFASDSGGVKVILPPIFMHTSNDRFTLLVFPFIFYSKSTLNDDVALFLAGIFYAKTGGNSSFWLFFAFVYHGSTNGAKIWLFPVYVSWSDTYSLFTIGGLIWFHKNKMRDARKFVIFPFIWLFHTPGTSLRFILFPFLWTFSGDSRGHCVFFPFVWYFRDLSSTFFLFIPAALYKRGGDSKRVSVFFLYNYHKTSSISSWNFFPLVWAKRTDSTYRFYFLPVFFYRTAPDLRIVHFWPIFGRTTTSSSTSSYVAYPLSEFYTSEKYSRKHIFPIFYSYKSDETSTIFVLPLYFHKKTKYYELKIITMALYIHRRFFDYRFTTAALLYLKLVNDRDQTSFVYFFPIYGKETRGHSSVRHYIFYPLYSKRTDKEADIFVLDILWPIFHYETSPDVKIFRLLPYWHSIKSRRDFRFFLPFYFSFTYKEGEGNHPHLAICIPFFIKKTTPTTGLILGSPFFLLPPFFYRSWVPNGNKSTTILFPLFGHSVDGPCSTKWFLLWLIRIFRDTESNILNFHVVLFFYRRKAEELFYAFFPIFFRSVSEGQYSGVIVPMIYWYNRSYTGNSLQFSFFYLHPSYFSLISHNAGVAGTRSWIFPIWWRAAEQGSRTTCLIWFYPRWVMLAKSVTHDDYRRVFLFPIFHYRRRDEARAFSLIWFVLPYLAMYRRVRVGDVTIAWWIWPLIFRRVSDQSQETSAIWLAPKAALYRRAITPIQNCTWLFPLFWTLREEGHVRRAYVWFFHPRASLYFVDKMQDNLIWHIFVLYAYSKIENAITHSGLWIIHPKVALVLSYKELGGEISKFYIFPLYYKYHITNVYYGWCALYFVPPEIAIIRSKAGLIDIPFIYTVTMQNRFVVRSILFFFSPKLSLIRITSDEEAKYLSVWMAILFYVEFDGAENSNTMAVFWLFKPGYSLIFWQQYAVGDLLCHVVLLMWFSVEEGNTSFGFLWLGFYQVSLAAYYRTQEYKKHYFLPVYYYISMQEGWKCSLFLWLIYIKGNDDYTDFRLLWRFIRVATGEKRILELQPIFYYKAHHGDTELMVFGGFCGRQSTAHRDKCRMCWVCVC